jgi:hypothetical protein
MLKFWDFAKTYLYLYHICICQCTVNFLLSVFYCLFIVHFFTFSEEGCGAVAFLLKRYFFCIYLVRCIFLFLLCTV